MKRIISALLSLTFALTLAGCAAPEETVTYDLIPMVMVDGALYLDTGKTSMFVGDDVTYDGEITSSVDGSEKPAENDQSNFGTGYKYRRGETDGTIELLMNNIWRIYATPDARQRIQFPDK